MRDDGPVHWSNPVDWSHPLNSGRVAWWLVNPQRWGGAHWYDLAGTHAGAISGAMVVGSTDRPGGYGAGALSGGYATVSGAPDLNFAGDFTLAAWIKTSTSTDQYVISKQQTSNPYTGYSLAVVSTGKVFVEVSDGTYSNVNGSAVVRGTGWRHILFTRSRGTSGDIYVDGVLDVAGSVRGGDTTYAIDARIGNFTGGGVTWNGFLDDVSAWSRSFSDGEVSALYDLSRRGYPEGLIRVGRVTFAASGAGAETILPAPGASIAITPGDASLLRSLVLPASGAAVAITPGTAVSTRSLILPAPGSSVAITPGTAAPFQSRILVATGGAVAVTPGTAASFRSLVLPSTGSTITVTPGTAEALRALVLPAPGGAITITPGTAALIPPAVAGVLPATGGTITVTPGSAELLRSLVLAATGNTITITPGTASLFTTAPGSTILAAPGASVAITPGTATVLRSRIVAATGSTVTITPGTAALIPPPVAGVLPATGSTITVTPGTAALFQTIPGEVILAATGPMITVTPGTASLSKSVPPTSYHSVGRRIGPDPTWGQGHGIGPNPTWGQGRAN